MSKRIPAFVIAYSNSDFTNPHEVVWEAEPQDCTGQFTHMGARFSGIETCRHCNTQIGDECLEYQHQDCNWIRIGLKERAKVDTIKVSTRWFTGNQVRAISVVLIDELEGTESQVIRHQVLEPDQDHSFTISPTPATEALVHFFHEGGISRIHFWGEKTRLQIPIQENLLEKGGISHISNAHYGSPQMAVKGCREEDHMVGWESARTGFGEQALFHLARPSHLEEIVVDTYLHRLNPPLTCHVFGLQLESGVDLEEALANKPRWKLVFKNGQELIPEDFQQYMLEERFLLEQVPSPGQFQISLQLPKESPWQAVLPFEPLRPDTYHRFRELKQRGPFTHLLYLHYPNGGIHGLKVHGREE